jgi:hypothetical protein
MLELLFQRLPIALILNVKRLRHFGWSIELQECFHCCCATGLYQRWNGIGVRNGVACAHLQSQKPCYCEGRNTKSYLSWSSQ